MLLMSLDRQSHGLSASGNHATLRTEVLAEVLAGCGMGGINVHEERNTQWQISKTSWLMLLF
jgi:hypothetical protein